MRRHFRFPIAECRLGRAGTWPGSSAVALLVCLALCAGSCARLSPHEAPPKADAIGSAIARGVGFLLGHQNKDGSWGSARNTTGMDVYAPVPGAHHAFRGAVTALCLAALVEVSDGSPAVEAAIERGEAWLLATLPRLRRAEPDAIYNVWGHAYGIQALAHLLRRHPDDAARRERIRALIRDQIGFLERYESVDGGWGYYDFRAHTQRPSGQPNSFTTATVLVALHEAKEAGVEPPERLVQRALAQVRRQQNPDFTYFYAEGFKWRPVAGINRPGGSLGRSQACNVALRLWGDPRITDGVLKTWLERLITRNGWLSMGRKRPIPHESWFQVAGYFFYYGHYYAALCIERLKPRDRTPFQKQLAGILLPLQEKDGSWWDFPLYNYHQAYGTAFALMSLQRCRQLTRISHQAPRPPCVILSGVQRSEGPIGGATDAQEAGLGIRVCPASHSSTSAAESGCRSPGAKTATSEERR